MLEMMWYLLIIIIKINNNKRQKALSKNDLICNSATNENQSLDVLVGVMDNSPTSSK